MKRQVPEQHIPRENHRDLKELLAYVGEHLGEKPVFQYRKDKEVISVSFRQFRDDVSAFGEYLLKKGIQEKTKVAVFGENHYAWLVTYFATVNTGNVIVPIDKELKAPEVATLLNDSESVLLCYGETKHSVVAEMQEIGVVTKDFLCFSDFSAPLEEGYAALNSGSRAYLDVPIDREEMCAIIYTSGTTGDPKGVMLSQKNLTFDAYTSMSCMIIPENTVIVLPMNHTFGFMACILCQIWMGHTIFINDSLKTILKDIQTAKPGHISVVPLFVENFYKNIWKAVEKQGKTKLLRTMIRVSNVLRKVGIDLRRVLFKSVLDNFGGNLEMIISGGAPISDEYMKGFDDLGVVIINGYGITECSPIVALNRNNNIRYGTVGKPVPGVEVKIENPDADGEGEIWVKGDIVMLGYYNKPEETARVLKDGWFNTEDIGKLDEDGFLSITGRKKNIIILDNGKNVYPEEIETLISFVPNVTEVVVYQEDTIVAEIYSDADGDPAEIQAEIRNAIQEINQQLAGYKRVNRIKFRDTEFEKTTTKKIKRTLIKH